MAEETESLTSSSTDPPPQGGQQEQEQREAQHSSSGGSNKEEGSTIDEESNKNLGSDSTFVVDDTVTAKFGNGTKVTASVRKNAMFVTSRQVANQVSDSRSLDLIDKVHRKGNGRNALDVVTPLDIGNNQVVVMIMVDYQQKMKGIVYDQEKGTMTCSDSALSTICKNAGGLVTLDAEEVKIIDDLLAKYLETLRWEPETTKSAEVLREQLEESNKAIDALTSTNDQQKDDIRKLKGEKKEMNETIKQLKDRIKVLEETKENNDTNNHENQYRLWCQCRQRFVDEEDRLREQDRLRMQQQCSYPTYQPQPYPMHQNRGNSGHYNYQSTASSSSSASSGYRDQRVPDNYDRYDYHSDSSRSKKKSKKSKRERSDSSDR